MSSGPIFDWTKISQSSSPAAAAPAPKKESSVGSQLAAGYHEELSSAYHAAKNVTGILDSAVKKVQRWTGKDADWSKSYVTQAMEEMEQHHKEAAQKAGPPQGTIQGLARSVGAAPVQVGEYGAAMVVARRPAAAMALVDAAKEYDKGLSATVKAGIGGATAGAALEYGSKFKLGPRIAANVGLGAGKALAEGQRLSGAVTQGLAQGAFGALPAQGKAKKLSPSERLDMVTKSTMPYIQSFQKTFAPATVDEPARLTAGNIREKLALGDLERNRAYHEGEEATKFFEQQPPDVGLQFFHDYETRNVPPGLRHFADSVKSISDNLWDRLNQRGLVYTYVNDYIKHIYKDPDAAGKQLEMMSRSKKPAQGAKGFSKARKYTTAEMAKATAGLELISSNPMDMVFAGLAEGEKAIAWHDLRNEEIAGGRGMWKRSGKPLPKGREHWTSPNIDDPTFVKYAPPAKGRPPGRLEVARYYGEPSSINLIENHLKPGLQGNPVWQGVRGYGNIMNGIQLGLSGRHAFTAAGYALADEFAMGMQQALRGNFKDAAKKLASSATVVGPAIENSIKGSKLLKEALKPGSVGGETAEILDKYLAGGGRLAKDQAYRTQMKKQFNEMWAQGKTGQALVRLPLVPAEWVSNLVMDKIVPTLKRGTAYKRLEMEMKTMGPTATRQEWRKAAGKIVDHMDNIMGEMVYENRFVKRVYKDLGQVLFRSLGWNWGDVAVFGGALKDVMTKGPLKAMRDSEKASFVAGLAVTTAYTGAITQMLFGQGWPKDITDYFHPRTGGTDANGNPERVHSANYISGDLYSLAHDTSGTIINKLNPAVSQIGETFRNKDWSGQTIRDPEHNIAGKAVDQAKYMAKQLLPLSISQPLDKAEQEGESSFSDFALPQVGINKSPLWIGQSPAERLASDILKGAWRWVAGGWQDGRVPQGAAAHAEAQEGRGYQWRSERRDRIGAFW